MILTILVVMVVGALATGAVVVGANHMLPQKYYERGSQLEMIADAGLELARARINGDPKLYPDKGYIALEEDEPVLDHEGNVIPGVTRSLYAGPTGITTGQYGIFGSIVAVVEDAGGGRVVRRSQVFQQSFARFAYFTNNEGDDIWFWDDILYGPVHSNDEIKLWGVNHFYAEVTTADTVRYKEYGTFYETLRERAAYIPMPDVQKVSDLMDQAAAGGTRFVGNNSGDWNLTTTRVEFVAVDLNGDGDTTDDDEGFFKVYQSSNEEWVSAHYYDGNLRNNENCGRWYGGSYESGGTFVASVDHPHTYDGTTYSRAQSLTSNANSRCYLGGDERLTNGFEDEDDYGEWLEWEGTVAPGLAGRPDADYLWPLARKYNSDFKGVIGVQGKVGVSGLLRGEVTLVSNQDIVILDDVTYATDPGAGTCQDMLGLFSERDVTVSMNLLNTAKSPWSGQSPRTYDDTGDEFIHGVILALDNFGAGDPDEQPDFSQDCEGNQGGRGCLYITGGIIQEERGAVGGSTTGYWKRYSWDSCALSNPPPYFPTTGHFFKGNQYSVDPVGFEVENYYESLSPDESPGNS